MVSILVFVLPLSGATSASGAIPKSKLLTLSDLPAGWSAIPPKSVAVLRSACLHGITAPVKHLTEDVVSYENAQATGQIIESLATGSGSSAHYRAVNNALNRCTDLKLSSGHDPSTGAIGAMSFQQVGNHSEAYSAHLIGKSKTGVDVVVFEAGSYMGVFVYLVTGTPNVNRFQYLVDVATSKVAPQSKGSAAITTPTSAAPAPGAPPTTQPHGVPNIPNNAPIPTNTIPTYTYTAPTIPTTSPPAEHTITYELSGNTIAASVLYTNSDSGNTVQSTYTPIPYTVTVQLLSGSFYSILAQDTYYWGTSLTCTVLEDGNQIAQNTSTGQYAETDCHGSVP